MNKHLKFKSSDYDKILFCSDFHYGHNKEFLYTERGFSSVIEHNMWLYEQWNKHVTENTLVFNLGDICFNDPKGENFESISNWKCKHHYVLWGNHNSGMKQCYKKALDYNSFPSDCEVYPLRFNNMTYVGNDLTITIDKQIIILSHFAKRIWDGVGIYAWHLSGHSHGTDLTRLPEATFGKSLDVGIEVAKEWTKTPFFAFNELKNEYMTRKNVEILDHHDTNTSYGI